MAETWNKREREKKKRQAKKDKQQRKQERKENNDKGKKLEDLIAYVDEFGVIRDTPPEPKKPTKSGNRE